MFVNYILNSRHDILKDNTTFKQNIHLCITPYTLLKLEIRDSVMLEFHDKIYDECTEYP